MINKLSPRQTEFRDYLLTALTIPEIAEKMGIAKHTGTSMAKSVYLKTGLSGRMELSANRINELEIKLELIKKLLVNPQPGLFTWNEALNHALALTENEEV